MRSARYPRGFPWLSGAARKSVTEANILVDFTAEVLCRLLERSPTGKIVLEHPEDLGKRSNGITPASIWRWPKIRALLNFPGVRWGPSTSRTLAR